MSSAKCFLRTAILTLALSMLCVMSAFASCKGIGTVTSEALRLRSEPSLDSAILATASKGDVVVVLSEEKDGWYKVDHNSVEGYMLAECLDFAAQADVELGWGIVEVNSSLNVRSGPGKSYDWVASLSDQTPVEIIGVDNGWYQIARDGMVGYVKSSYVTLCLNSQGRRGDDPVFNTGLAQEIVAYAKEFLGRPYVWGGNGPKSFDCSGFTKYVYAHFGYELNRTASTQRDNGRKVRWTELQPGDLLMFHTVEDGPYVSHVGIYIGNGEIIHAASGYGKIVISDLNTNYFISRFVCARRIIEDIQ